METKIQEIQKVCADFTAMLFKAASQLTSVCRSLKGKMSALDSTSPMNLLKDLFSLAGRVNQFINRLRWHLIKATLP